MSRERDNSEALKIVAETIIGDKEGKNIVFVFGAGASIESGMAPTPLLKDSVKGFLLALRDTEHGKDIQKNLSRKFNVDMEEAINMASLEYLISMGCEVFGEKQMLNWLRQYIPDIYSTDIRYFAPISYEFVAHLMGNRLVRYVVSLNYDELLDMTIEEELGKDKCYRAATDEDFERLKNGMNWENIARCFLFKPHGTMSIPLSIKHKYEQTLEFPNDRAEVLRRLFKNRVLVLIGYSGSDQDFRFILLEQLLIGNIKKVVIVKGNPNEVINKFPPIVSKKYFIRFRGRAEKFFKELENELKDHDKYKFYTKATRHFIRWSIYRKLMPGVPGSSNYDNNLDKLKSVVMRDHLFFTRLNLLVEILILCFKTRGLFTNISFMNCNRIISALSEHLKKSESSEKRAEVKELLQELVDECILKPKKREGKLESYWYYLPLKKCKNLDTYTEPKEEKHKEINCDEEQKEVAELFKDSANNAIEWLNNKYLSKVEPLTPDEKDNLVKYLCSLKEDFDYDLAEQYTPSYLIFKNPEYLDSRKKFRYERTNAVLKPEENKQSCLYIITLTGEWLRQHVNNSEQLKELKKFNKIRILTEEEIEINGSIHHKNTRCFIREIEDKLENENINVKFKKAKAMDHHMTLQFWEDKAGVIGRAIYFFRYGKSSSFAPFYISDSEDIRILKDFFEELWGAK